jgi:hypothetical protein
MIHLQIVSFTLCRGPGKINSNGKKMAFYGQNNLVIIVQVSTWFANARRHLKKENQMTGSPRHGPNNENDDEDEEGGEGSIMANQQRQQQFSGKGDTVEFPFHNKPGASNVKCPAVWAKCHSTTLLCGQWNSPPPSSIQQGWSPILNEINIYQ